MNQLDDKGYKQGYWERYYLDSKLKSKGSYINDKKDGLWGWYYNHNGKLFCKGCYINGIKDGYWERYTNGGNLFEKEFVL